MPNEIAVRPLLPGALVKAALLSIWLFGVDLWVDHVARVAACGATAWTPWSIPVDCRPVALPNRLELGPVTRPRIFGIPIEDPIDHQLFGLGALAIATALSIVVLRWRARSGSDAYALGCFWAGALALAVPALVGAPDPIAPLRLVIVLGETTHTIPLALADAWIVIAVLWLLGRVREKRRT